MNPLSPVYKDPAMQILSDIFIYIACIVIVISALFLISLEVMKTIKISREREN